MKCPTCSKEISDQSLFCGYCGAKIEKATDLTEAMESDVTESDVAESEPAETQAMKSEPSENKSSVTDTGPQRGKRYIGLTIVLILSFLSVISGLILGFICAKGILDWQKYVPAQGFEWTDFSESDKIMDDNFADGSSNEESADNDSRKAEEGGEK